MFMNTMAVGPLEDVASCVTGCTAVARPLVDWLFHLRCGIEKIAREIAVAVLVEYTIRLAVRTGLRRAILDMSE